MRISDWSSYVCSSDLDVEGLFEGGAFCGKRRLAFAPCNGFRLFEGEVPVDHVAAVLECILQLAHELRDARRIVGQPGRRSEERRVGKECVSTCRSRGSPDNEKTKTDDMRSYKD